MGLASTSDATQVLHRKHIPNYAFPERVGSTLAAMLQRRIWLQSMDVVDEPAEMSACDRDTAQMTIDAGLEVIQSGAANGSEGWMSPEQVEVLLSSYCIPTPPAGLAPDAGQAVPLAATIGYPVVLKLAVEGLTHKSDVGGVKVNVKTAREVRAAFAALVKKTTPRLPGSARVKGAYVQRMVKGETELIVGVVRDAQFGPLVMAGIGGTQVELKRDVTFELAPLSRRQADAMLDRTGAGSLLQGFRGSTPADRQAAVEVILQLAQIALDFPQIAEIEVNPLIVMPAGEGTWAVDARVRLHIAASQRARS
jgi:acetyltransferase